MVQHSEHKAEAERLLEEGRATARRVHDLDDWRKGAGHNEPISAQEYARITASMDEYGKKAMGIWAQAQVHATLSLKDSGVN